MAGWGRAAAMAAWVVAVLWLAVYVGIGAGLALDELYLETRFTRGGASDGCPIAVWRDQAIPMCRPLYPGW